MSTDRTTNTKPSQQQQPPEEPHSPNYAPYPKLNPNDVAPPPPQPQPQPQLQSLRLSYTDSREFGGRSDGCRPSGRGGRGVTCVLARRWTRLV